MKLLAQNNPPLVISSFQDTVRKMCNLVSIRLASDAVVFAGNQEACEHAVKFLESQIKHLFLAAQKKRAQHDWVVGSNYFLFSPLLGEDSHFD